QRFGERGVNLYIKNSDEINAFAIGSLGRKSIALTVGLIQHYHNSSEDEEEFLSTLRSIIGHEMSHLVNKDFLPALLIITNQKVTNFVSHILHMILNLVSYIFSFSRTNGIISDIFLRLYGIINWILCAFNNLVVYNIYEFLRKFVSRSIEYRCDRQSAQAFGGYNMALALSFLGKSGYFTLFSTHPATQRRVKKVENIKIKKGIIRPSISSSIANFISLMLLVTICAIAAKEAKVDLWVRYYLENPQELGRLIQPVKKLYLKFF
ncbi:MAG: M48 family metalloprotease, partial [Proteobacteria bacterium]|nr:M48 family metalloprotease [Pseudomonadota bacterium]